MAIGVFPWDRSVAAPIRHSVTSDTAAADAAGLHDRDGYAWTQDQAARRRALPPGLRPNGHDVEHLAEEVEDPGKSQQRAVKSHQMPRIVTDPRLRRRRRHKPAWLAA